MFPDNILVSSLNVKISKKNKSFKEERTKLSQNYVHKIPSDAALYPRRTNKSLCLIQRVVKGKVVLLQAWTDLEGG
jgi:predicted RNase H-like nuclease